MILIVKHVLKHFLHVNCLSSVSSCQLFVISVFTLSCIVLSTGICYVVYTMLVQEAAVHVLRHYLYVYIMNDV